MRVRDSEGEWMPSSKSRLYGTQTINGLVAFNADRWGRLFWGKESLRN